VSDSYSFDPISIMASELMQPYQIIFIQSEVNAIRTVKDNSSWLRAAFVISALFTGFALLIGPMTGVWHQRRLCNCLPVGFMCIATFFWFCGAVTATSVYFHLRDAFNNDTRLNVNAHMGHQMFAWVWLGVWTSWVAAAQWCCAAICCPGGHRKRRIEFRRRTTLPFSLNSN
jgi:SUR7/PalI family